MTIYQKQPYFIQTKIIPDKISLRLVKNHLFLPQPTHTAITYTNVHYDQPIISA